MQQKSGFLLIFQKKFGYINIYKYLDNIMYECNKCMKIFNKKSSYDTHLARRYPCIKNNNNNNICINCNKLYSTKYNLKVHMIICNNTNNQTIINENNIQLEELKKMFEKKLEEQQKKIDELSQQSESNISAENITVNNTTTNNTTNNIIIYNVGKEDLSRLSKEDIIKICTSGTYYPIVAAEIIHCNEKYPEFQNFLISNERSNTGKVLIDDKWVSKTQEEIFKTLLKVDKGHVSTLIKDLEVDNKLKLKLESTQDEIDTNESKEHQIPKIKEKLYNASKMIIKNKKKTEKLSDN
jgi:hypothetical protein